MNNKAAMSFAELLQRGEVVGVSDGLFIIPLKVYPKTGKKSEDSPTKE